MLTCLCDIIQTAYMRLYLSVCYQQMDKTYMMHTCTGILPSLETGGNPAICHVSVGLSSLWNLTELNSQEQNGGNQRWKEGNRQKRGKGFNYTEKG